MNLQQKLKLLESLDEVSVLNTDFKDLKSLYLCETRANANRENFKAEYIILFTSIIIIIVYWLRKYTKQLEFKMAFLQIQSN